MTIPKEIPIKDVALGIYDGPHATPQEATDGAVFLGIKNITDDGRINLSDIRYISENDMPRWTKRVKPTYGDIVFTYEATLHRYAIIPEGFHGCLGRRVALIRPDTSKVNAKFLLHYFLTANWRTVVERFIITGATVDRIPIEKFPDFPVYLPPLAIQEKIAGILSAYDDLIENNLRRIELLETSARLIYKEWFVKLNFPGREHTKIVDGVPEGWTKRQLKDIAFEYRENVNYDTNLADVPYIGLEHIPRKSITLYDWGRFEEAQSTKHKFCKNDILFGKIRAYFHKVGFATTEGVSSADAIVIRPKDNVYYAYVLLSVSTENFISYATQVGVGAKMPRSNWNVLEQYEMLIPPKTLLNILNETFEPIQNQLTNLSIQIKKLKQARDLLLPKLMSGEIPV